MESVPIPIHLRNLPPPDECFDHTSFITFLAQWIKPRVYLELGVRYGPIIKNMLPLARRIIGVDLKKDQAFNQLPVEFYEMSTEQFFDQAPGLNLQVDLALIDADHSHESSLRDFDRLFPYVIEDGIICLHDTYPINEYFTRADKCSDSWRTAHFIRQNYGERCEILTLPFQPGLSIVRKSTRQLAWKDDSTFEKSEKIPGDRK